MHESQTPEVIDESDMDIIGLAIRLKESNTQGNVVSESKHSLIILICTYSYPNI
jgi:hypothetical protein